MGSDHAQDDADEDFVYVDDNEMEQLEAIADEAEANALLAEEAASTEQQQNEGE